MFRKRVFRRRAPKRKYVRRAPYGRKRRFFKGKFSRKNASVVVSDPRNGALSNSDRYFLKLKTSVTTQLGGMAIDDTQSFLGNGFNGGTYPGSQALSSLYGSYRIWGSGMKIRFVNTTNGGARLTIVPSVDPNFVANTYTADQVSRMAYSRECFTGAPGGMDKSVTKQFMKTCKMWGQPKDVVSKDPNYGALTTVNTSAGSWAVPAKLWYWNVVSSSLDQTTNVTGSLIVDITYYVELFDRRNPVA